MLDLGLVEKALAGDGKDTDDARLSAVESAGASDAQLAAETARLGLEKGSTDVRLIAAYLLGAFVEQGPKSLPGIFEALRGAVTARWLSLRPEERKARVVDGTLARLFRSIVNHVDAHEQMQDATFKAWIRSDHDAVGGPALRASSALREALTSALDAPRCTAPLSDLDARIRAHFDRHPAPPKPAPRPLPEPEPEEATAEEATVEPEEPAPAPEDEGPRPAAARGGSTPGDAPELDRRTIPVSPAFELLLRKLEAVPALLSRDEPERAAVVADDIRRTLKSFDPKVFFPDVFVPYLRFLAGHVEQLAPHWDAMGSPQWEALEQLYQVDPDHFMTP
ncbi:type VI secretion system protein IglI family protein [Sorangium sp. So ce327]|uniref:type VI secretion system protein IglI family protein n=1 Tax=Sorangium sp. So ce327 TaxID=3133301 RepID=UPI003F5D5E88